MDPALTPAAQYVRMSTEHQKYSIEGQAAANAAYAAARGYGIVRTYADAGISGLRLDRREGLKALLADVLGGAPGFSVILVYDVSRWGRFQDPDEGAHYEFLCRAAGAPVEYTSEAFSNDGTVVAHLVKNLKRVMAAEYSRELSVKISRAHRALGAKGYWQGGPAGLGLRRAPLAPDGSAGPPLMAGEHNGVRGRRVTLVHGPSEEVELVRTMFRWAADGMSARRIAKRLNARGAPFAPRGRWEAATISQMLRNEKYVGTNVVGQRRHQLGAFESQPREAWIRAEGAFEPIVPLALFRQVRRRVERRHAPASDQELLNALAAVLKDRGRLSFSVIKNDPRTHAPQSYVRRFGGLENAYRLVGYEPTPYQKGAAERARRHRPHTARRGPPRADAPAD